MTISNVITKRVSTRAYLAKPVSDDDLAKIVDAGRWAPNAGPFHLSVIRNAELQQKINDRTHQAMLSSGNDFLKQRASLPGYQPLYSAPLLILISCPTDAPFGAINAALSAENMLLEATSLGLGTCFLVSPAPTLNDAANADLAKQAGIPAGHTVYCAVIAGYAAAENKFSKGERVRKGDVSHID